MTNNTLKTTIESLLATSALVVVTLDGTFNSQTGAPVLSARTRPDQRNAFLKSYCEKVDAAEARGAEVDLKAKIEDALIKAQDALVQHDFSKAIKFVQEAATAQEQLDQPRMYYRVKPNVDLRTVAEKRAARKADNAAKKAAKQEQKEQKASDKMSAAVQSQQEAAPAPADSASKAAPSKSGGKKSL